MKSGAFHEKYRFLKDHLQGIVSLCFYICSNANFTERIVMKHIPEYTTCGQGDKPRNRFKCFKIILGDIWVLGNTKQIAPGLRLGKVPETVASWMCCMWSLLVRQSGMDSFSLEKLEKLYTLLFRTVCNPVVPYILYLEKRRACFRRFASIRTICTILYMKLVAVHGDDIPPAIIKFKYHSHWVKVKVISLTWYNLVSHV